MIKGDRMSDIITLEISTDEAIVFYDWLKRFNEKEDNLFNDQAEERVLWDLEALLEKNLLAPFKENYNEILQQARSRVRDV